MLAIKGWGEQINHEIWVYKYVTFNKLWCLVRHRPNGWRCPVEELKLCNRVQWVHEPPSKMWITQGGGGSPQGVASRI